MRQFYNVADNSTMAKVWARATKIYPESDEVIIDCKECGRIGRYPKKEFSVDIDSGGKYPDMLFCGQYPLTIVSERVINDWNKDGVTGFSYFKVGIKNVLPKKLKAIEPPKYFHVVVNGRCEVDLKKMDLKIKKICKSCGEVFFDKPLWQNEKFFLKESTWDGLDLFVSELFPRRVLCTEKVVISACKNKHTNFFFSIVEEARMATATAIDYLRFCKKKI